MTGKGTMYILVLSCWLPIAVLAQKSQFLKQDTNSYVYPRHKKITISPQLDLMSGVSRLDAHDRSGLAFSGSLKAIYHLTGALSLNAGLGFAQLKSLKKQPDYIGVPDTVHKESILSVPVGLSFDIGNGQAEIINSIYIIPSYYIKEQKFALGAGAKFGFLIKTKGNLYLGLIGELQLLPLYKSNHILPVRYGFAGAGIAARWNY